MELTKQTDAKKRSEEWSKEVRVKGQEKDWKSNECVFEGGETAVVA
jgi:hypothetical protein